MKRRTFLTALVLGSAVAFTTARLRIVDIAHTHVRFHVTHGHGHVQGVDTIEEFNALLGRLSAYVIKQNDYYTPT
jgi:hypothetical protein